MNAAPDELQAPLDAAEGQADRHSLLNPRCVPAAQHTAATDGRAAVALGCCGSAAAVALREPTLRARPPLRFLFRNLAGLFAADPDCANRRAGQLPQRAMMFAGSSVDDEIELKKLQARARGREREREREQRRRSPAGNRCPQQTLGRLHPAATPPGKQTSPPSRPPPAPRRSLCASGRRRRRARRDGTQPTACTPRPSTALRSRLPRARRLTRPATAGRHFRSAACLMTPPARWTTTPAPWRHW
jgi:hypothetical protein